MNELKEPLVSIIVITFNSSKYVLETLESAKAQTYQNIELIVSDDCSTDNTVEICSKWINENKDRFVRAELITVEKNSGVAPNCNRGIKVANGKWIKIIAGDDMLLENCIKDNVDYSNTIKDSEWISSKVFLKFNDILNAENHSRLKKAIKINSQKEFIKQMLILDFISSPTVFISKDVVEKNGFFNEQIPMLEDSPFWLKLFEAGVKLHFLEKETVIHRIYENSISFSTKDIIKSSYYKSQRVFFDTIVKQRLVKNFMFLELLSQHVYFKYYGSCIQKGGRDNMSFMEKSIRFISPKWWKNHFPIFRILKKNVYKVLKLDTDLI